MRRLLRKWTGLGTATSLTEILARLITYTLLLFFSLNCITVVFKWPEQAVLGTVTIALAFAIHRTSKTGLVTLALMFASLLATARYAFWRCSMVFQAAVDPDRPVGRINLAFMLILLSAEIYAVIILFLGYIQTSRPLRRPPAPLPPDVEQWPHVDILIPTYNEPLLVVRTTAFAARNIDYPSDKLHVYVLDDGRREEFQSFCEKAEIGYITRKDNKHAKAGNLNSAMRKLGSPYVAIFDCGHVPTRSFLQMTLGSFHKDKRLGMLQTPHFFYSPDPFVRNLHEFKTIPNEGELFYGIIQDCNDLWNATFFCGSCAVLRRTALDEIGGVATETVTEDAHTSLRMQMHRWNTAYINIPQAAGLATESLSSHVGQRIRSARGMIQALRTELMTLILYSRADTWLAQSTKREMDRPLRTFANLVGHSITGVGYALETLVPKRKIPAPVRVSRAGSAVAMLALLIAGPSRMLHAETVAGTPRTAAVANISEGAFHSTFTLKDVGVPDAIQFRGVDASKNIVFALSQTQVAQQAKLNLHYSFSPGLLSQVSHLNVMLNGALIASLPVPQKAADIQNALSTSLTLPSELLARNNVLGFQFIGHYTLSCEDPANTVLWGRVENNSSIDVSGSLLPLSDNLNLLPLPFYDESVGSTTASIPFAFASQPGPGALQAAGIVASWFGIRAKSRALTFPVTLDGKLPKGNVVLFVDQSSGMPAGLDLGTGGPVIAIRTNPNDPFGKVLILAGDDGAQLVTAARSLALENTVFQGSTSQVSDFQMPAPRQADDAPLWLRTDRVSPFWNYSQEPALQSDGSGTLPVYVRIPPDLFFGEKTTVPLHLDYRYNAVPLAGGSTMRVSANGSLVNELALPQRDNPKQMLNAAVSVPLVDMRPFANTFLFKFFFQIAKQGPCRNTPPLNLQGALLRSSYFDLRGLNHWAAMPNLELFANAGFPFTRFADLSQSIVVLPPRASAQEIGLYLMFLGYFGEQTGYPALRLQIDDSAKLGKDADYLILGTAEDQPAFEQLSRHLPIAVSRDGISVQDTGGFFAAIQRAWWQVAELRPDWWWKLTRSQDKAGVIASLGDSPDAVIQGIESPWKPGRSMVTVTIKNDDSVAAFSSAFLKASGSASIGDSVSVLQGSEFTSYRLGDRFYQVGHLPWWTQVRYRLREFPWLIVLLTFVLGLFVVPWTKARLDHRTQARLEGRPV